MHVSYMFREIRKRHFKGTPKRSGIHPSIQNYSNIIQVHLWPAHLPLQSFMKISSVGFVWSCWQSHTQKQPENITSPVEVKKKKQKTGHWPSNENRGVGLWKVEISHERQHWLNPISLWINRPFTQIIIQGDSDVIRESLSSLVRRFEWDNQQQVRAEVPRVDITYCLFGL